jgi:hypothetical protein
MRTSYQQTKYYTIIFYFGTISPAEHSINGKGKVVSVLSYLSTTPWRRMGSGCIDPCFLDLGNSWRWVVSFTPQTHNPRGNSPGTHWIGGWVGSRTGLVDVEKRRFSIPLGLELQSLCRPTRSQSLYGLRYPGSTFHKYITHNLLLYEIHV